MAKRCLNFVKLPPKKEINIMLTLKTLKT